MNMKPKNLILIPVLIICLALVPNAHAVSPPPDGGYPGGNTAGGQKALLSLSTGTYNTAVGVFSLLSNTEGNFNTGVGAGTLLLNTARENTAVGAGALLNNTTGSLNTAHGAFALFSNTEGTQNTAIGDDALFYNTVGHFNTAVGAGALYANTEGVQNTATGAGALLYNTTGSSNTANGVSTLTNNTDGDLNTATGSGALYANTTGLENSAFGALALTSNTTGRANVAVGISALRNNIGGFGNVAIGTAALFDNVSGELNVAVGNNAGRNLTGFDNICIGSLVQGVPGESYTTRIKNIYSSVASGRAVFVDEDHKLGTLLSTRRVKDDIKPMDRASEAILALEPVTFRYKKEVARSGAIQFGLIAEQVAEVDSDLVILDAAGKPESVRYEAINTMLLNEFLKEHKKVQDLEAMVVQQQKGMETLTEQLKEQASQIQRVSAEIQLNKFATGRIRHGGPAAQQLALKSP
jgi:trimeric autotransporter adhesin